MTILNIIPSYLPSNFSWVIKPDNDSGIVVFSIFHISGKKIIFENADLHTSIRRDETFCCVNLTSYFRLYKHRAV